MSLPKIPFMMDGVLVMPFRMSPNECEYFNNLLIIEDIPICHFLKAEYFETLLNSRRLHVNRVDGYSDDRTEGMRAEGGFAGNNQPDQNRGWVCGFWHCKHSRAG